jgi:serine/threonine-protein kinase
MPSGHLTYLHQGTLFAVPFDVKRLETRGTAIPIVEDIACNPNVGSAQLAFSQTGVLVYTSGKSETATRDVVWMDATGKRRPLLAVNNGPTITPRLSPDGKRLAVSINGEIFVHDLERAVTTPITFTASQSAYPVWSPDGKHIAFENFTHGIWWTRADGSTQPVRIFDSTGRTQPGSFSPDGKRLAFSMAGDAGIWVLPLDTSDPDHPKPGKPELFFRTLTAPSPPIFSPDGQWVAYTSSDAGRPHVWVRPYPADARQGQWKISTVPGLFPVWSNKAQELFYETSDGRIMVVRYTVRGDTLAALTPQVWCDTPIVTTGPVPNLDLAPDGKRFAVLALPESAARNQQSSVHVTFVENIFDLMRRRLP